MAQNMNRYLGPDPNSSMMQIRARDPIWFEHARDVSICAGDIILRLSVHSGDVRELVSAVLYRRIASAFEAVIVLAERGMYTEGLNQRRSMLEGLFILGALWKKPHLVETYLDDDQHRVLRVLKNVKRTSPMIQEALAPELPLAAIDEKVADLKPSTAGRNATTAAAYAEAAGLLDYYLTDYSFSSEAAHHVAKDLERQIALNEDGSVNGVYWGPEAELPSELLSNAVDYMLMAIVAAEGIFELAVSEAAGKLRATTDRLHEATLASATPSEPSLQPTSYDGD